MLARLRHPLALVLLVALAALPACGGDDDEDDEATSTTAAAAPPAQATTDEAVSSDAASGEDSGTAAAPPAQATETVDEQATGGDTGAAGTPASPEDDAAVRAAIQEYIDAFVNSDGEKACALMKPEVAEAFLEAVQGQLTAESCADAFEQAAASGGDQLGALFQQAEVTGVSAEGDTATAQLTVLGTTVPIMMERIDGEWKVANLPGQ